MPFPLKFASALVLLAFPLIEIALLIKAGAMYGFWPVALVVLTTAFAGASIIRAHGLAIFSRLASRLDAGGSGFDTMADTFLAVIGGLLLIFPGLICDVLGALLSIPPLRSALVRSGLPRALAGEATRSDRPHETRRPDTPERRGAGGPIIEGDYERVEEAAAGPPAPQRHLDGPN
jgi:UPF0716 protein FxsA